MRERRYQLKKEAVGVVRHHPWLFRDHLSSAASVFGDGERLRLFDGTNRVVAHGVYAKDGAIAVRVVRAGAAPPDAAWLRGRLTAAVGKRAELAKATTGVRLLHGESDGVPAVVADRFGDAVVVTSYAAGFDGMARYVARWIGARAHAHASDHDAVAVAGDVHDHDQRHVNVHVVGDLVVDRDGNGIGIVAGDVVGPASTIVLRRAHRRISADTDAEPTPPRVLRGALGVATFREDALVYTVDLAGGQKTGAYLDLRGLRRAVAAEPLTGARVLNLFAYTGMLGRAAEHAGAARIVQVDASAAALAFAREHHVADAARHDFITADAFDWLPAHDAQHDVVIVDPPAMTSRAAQVGKVLAAYRSLYRAAAKAVAPGGQLVAACCTSRVPRDAFRDTVAKALGDGFAMVRELAPEADHPVGFPQADYLKIGWWRRTS